MWLLQTKFLASVGWKQGCQPFSCPCSLTVTHCRKEICFTYLFQESMPFGKSKPPLPTRSLRFLRATVRSTSSALWLHHAHPFVAAEEQKPVSCREAEGLVTELWSPRIVTYNTVIVSKIWITGCWLRSQLWHVTDANQWTIFEIELLATVGWKQGCQPFSCPCSLNVTHCRKEIWFVRHVCFRNPCLLGNLSLHSLPEAWGPWELQYAPPVLHYACIMPIPSLQLQKKDLSHAEKQRVWSRSCGLQELLQYNTDCAPMWLLQTNEQLSRLSF